jgi:hypothetical protein
MAVTMKNAVFLDVRGLLITANVVPSSWILGTVMMEALRSSETSVLTRATRRNIPEDGVLLQFHHVRYCRVGLFILRILDSSDLRVTT